MDFVKLLVTLIIAIYAKRGLPVDDTQQQRLEGVANDIWAVTENDGPFKGESAPGLASEEAAKQSKDAAHLANALVLTAIAAHESGFWDKVQTCEACYRGSIWCDKGRSISIYQLHEGGGAWGKHSRQEICEDNKLASQLAWNIVVRNKKAMTPLNVFNGYARGGRRFAGSEMNDIFAAMLKKTNLTIVYGSGLVAKFKPEKKLPVQLAKENGNNFLGFNFEERDDIVSLNDVPFFSLQVVRL